MVAHSQMEIWRMNQGDSAAGDEKRPEEKERRHDAAHLYHKHHRVADLVHRIEFYKRIDQRPPHDLRIKKNVFSLFTHHTIILPYYR